MDLLSLSRESFKEIIEFSRNQGLIWIRTLRDPETEIFKNDPTATETAWASVQFAFFMLAISLAIEIPLDATVLHMNLQRPTTFVSDMVINAICFPLWGFILYFSGKMVGGKGQIGSCVVAGLFLSAFFPFFQAAQYVLASNSLVWTALTKEPVAAFQTIMQWPETMSPSELTFAITATIMSLAIMMSVLAWFCVKSFPVTKRLHAIGIVRYLLILIIQFFMVLVLDTLVFLPLQNQLSSPK